MRGLLFVLQSTRTTCMHRSTCAAFFSSTHLCMHTRNIWYTCACVPTNVFEQEVLCVLTELNVIEIACIVFAHITTSEFHSSSNQTVSCIASIGLCIVTTYLLLILDIISSKYYKIYIMCSKYIKIHGVYSKLSFILHQIFWCANVF